LYKVLMVKFPSAHGRNSHLGYQKKDLTELYWLTPDHFHRHQTQCQSHYLAGFSLKSYFDSTRQLKQLLVSFYPTPYPRLPPLPTRIFLPSITLTLDVSSPCSIPDNKYCLRSLLASKCLSSHPHFHLHLTSIYLFNSLSILHQSPPKDILIYCRG
jgi:hypothetical protein